MTLVGYLVVSLGLATGLLLLAFGLAKGRAVPAGRVAWILGLVVLGLDTALHLVASAGMLASGSLALSEAGWFLLGTLGFVAMLAVAFVRPRWAGWALLATAVAVPLIFGLGGLLVTSGADAMVPWPVAAVTYSVPAVISGGLLVLSTRQRKPTAGSVGSAEPHVGAAELQRR